MVSMYSSEDAAKRVNREPDVSWAQLDLLTSLPAVDFSAAPQVEVVFLREEP